MSRRFQRGSRLIPVVLGQLISLGLGLLGTRWITRWVPPEVNGVYQVQFLTLCQFGLLLTHPGLVNHASRYWARERSAGRGGPYLRFLWREFWNRWPWLSVILAGCCGILWGLRGHVAWLALIPVLVLVNIVVALQSAAVFVVNVGERHWQLLALNSIAALARALLPVGAVMVLGLGVVQLGLGYGAHAVAVLMVIWMILRSERSEDADKQAGSEWSQRWMGELASYGRPFLILGIGNWFLQFADRWVVSLLFGEERAGLFATASNLAGYGPNVVMAALMQLVFPSVFRAADEARSLPEWRTIAGRLDRCTGLFLGMTLVGLVVLSWIGPWLLGWLIDRRYEPSMGMLLPAGLAVATVQINQFQFLLLQGQHNSSGMVRVMLGVATLKTVGSVLAGAMFGWNGLMVWLSVSVVLCGWFGRQQIRSIAFQWKEGSGR